MRLVTWNINSVRTRLELAERLIAEACPDVLCLQEIKATENEFPAAFFAKHGYAHQAIRGQKAYHGVATLSKLPLENIHSLDWCGKGDARHIAATLPCGSVLHNFYVPAGGDVPDPALNEKFAHKLDFLDEMTAWSRQLSGHHIVVGDLNVAPLEADVWSHRQLLDVVSHTPAETERMAQAAAAHGFIDSMRHFIPAPEKLYTWWSYRASDWRASNRGRRLDHVWVSAALKERLKAMHVMDALRDAPRPSDHAPVIVDFHSASSA